MAHKCFNCYKKSVMGTQHRHRPGVAGRQHLRKAPRTPKLFMPNLHTAYLLNDGYSKKVKLCSRCRRMLKNQGRIKVWKKEEKAPEQKNTKAKDQMSKRSNEQKVISKVPQVVKEKPMVKKEKKIENKIKEQPVTKPRKTKSAPVPTVSVEELVGKK